jgi:hypothetical protein
MAEVIMRLIVRGRLGVWGLRFGSSDTRLIKILDISQVVVMTGGVFKSILDSSGGCLKQTN